jgi:hypothetical protein
MNSPLELHGTIHMPNNTLVPTRKGEAPLLAAQRGRSAATECKP